MLSIIPDFDVVEDRCLSNRTAVPNRIAEFAFHRTKEALDTCIIPAFRLAAHARSHAKYFQDISKVFTRVMASAIRIKDCSTRRFGDVHTCRDFQHALERSVHGSFGLREPERLAVSLAIHNSPQEKPRATCRFAARNATLSLLLDEGVFHRDSLAKNVAAAFFMISRSSRSAAFSRRRRRISPSCELVTAFSVSVAAPWPSLRRHVCNRDG